MNFFRKRMNKKGFTLIELIIVIAILGILAALAIPRFFGFTESARISTDEEYVAVVANAAILYYAENDVLPALDDLDESAGADAYVEDYTVTSDKYAGGDYTIIAAAAPNVLQVFIDLDDDDTLDAGDETDSLVVK